MEKIELILQYSPWFIPLCLFLGVIYAAILYYRERHNDFSTVVRYTLASIRFLLVSFIAFLLLSPLIKRQSHQTEKPIIIFSQDFSSSILMNDDSTYYKTAYKQKVDSVLDILEKDYQVERLGFGQHVSRGHDQDFHQPYTDMGEMVEYIDDTYENRNLGAIFIASDGIVNKGTDPYYLSRDMMTPFYGVAMGDTTVKSDLKITAVQNNDIAYKGNKFPLEVDVSAVNANNEKSLIQVYKNSELLESKSITVDSRKWQKKFSFVFEASEKGMQQYDIRLKTIDSENNTMNNYQKVFIEVLESKQRVLLLGRRPHPDIAAIKKAIQKNPNYEIDVEMLSQWNKKPEAYNLVILHGLPSGGNREKVVIQQLKEIKVPVWFIIGTETDINTLNRFGNDLQVVDSKQEYEGIKGELNPYFTLFSINKYDKGILPAFPPLQSLYGKFKAIDDSRILVYKKIGDVSTSSPLWAFAKDEQQKYAITFGEGIWRWRIYNYIKENNHQMVDELIRKTVKYLVAREDKSRFRIDTKPRFSEFEDIIIRAELYNQSYELVNEPEVKLVIKDAEGNQYPYVMSRQDEAYEMKMENLSPGSYSFKANVKLGNEQFEETGTFVVEDVNLESLNTVADYNMLFRIAGQDQGDVITAHEINQIPEIIEKVDLKPVSYTMKEYVEWVHLKWLLIVLLVLLTTEWLIRKLNGAI
ncbi:MAG: hypothetical protein K9H84_02250 [Bacteroidales bacterium]|nr:hypothetical protein [Bacteroidales bacterium]